MTKHMMTPDPSSRPGARIGNSPKSSVPVQALVGAGGLPREEVRVTVVIPARNEEARIGQCVHSIFLAAGTANLEAEVIVVDDNSSDATAARAEAAGVTVLRQPQRMGPLAAWAAGVAAATTRWIIFVDGDCTVGQAALGELVGVLGRPGIGVAAARAVPLASPARSWLIRGSTRFSATLLDQVKMRLSNHDFLPIGRLMAIRKEAWAVTATDAPPCDRRVASSAKAVGWKVVWVPSAKVYYQPATSYGALRSEWLRTRRALHFMGGHFEKLPARVLFLAAWAAMFQSPLDAAAWATCHTTLVVEQIARRPGIEISPSWDTYRGEDPVASRSDAKTG